MLALSSRYIVFLNAPPPVKSSEALSPLPLRFCISQCISVHRSDAMEPAGAAFSVRNTFKEVAVLLTGATGYLGSLVLEQLLRCCPDVGTVYVLCRDKKGASAETRVRRLLHSGVFHLVRDRPELLKKVALLRGDLLSPERLLGIPAACEGRPDPALPPGTSDNGHDGLEQEAPVCWDPEGNHVRLGCISQLQAEPNLVVIHSAARIALQDHIHVTLQHNYTGTQRLLELVQQLPGARVFLHVSTAYVNCCKPFLPSGTPKEQLYPLHFGDSGKVHHAQLVQQLMSLEPDQAGLRCKYLCHMWGFPNTYVLGKHLTEQLVVEQCAAARLRVSIVRPSLVGAIAGLPYPGFVGNLAGPSGYAMALALGWFKRHVTMFTSWNHYDCVPGDTAASIIITAAAAALVGHIPSSLAAPDDGNGKGAPAVPIYHAAASILQPMSHLEVFSLAKQFFKVHPAKHTFGKNMARDPDYKPVTWMSVLARGLLKLRVNFAASLLRCVGYDQPAVKLQAGLQHFMQTQAPQLDSALFFDISNVVELDQMLSEEERVLFPLLWDGNWVRYAHTYMAAVLKLFMGQDVPPSADHSFVHIPSRRVV